MRTNGAKRGTAQVAQGSRLTGMPVPARRERSARKRSAGAPNAPWVLRARTTRRMRGGRVPYSEEAQWEATAEWERPRRVLEWWEEIWLCAQTSNVFTSISVKDDGPSRPVSRGREP